MAGTNKRRSAKPITKDEARRIAVNIAKLRSYCASPDRIPPPPLSRRLGLSK
jgi:hypothetical protein